jgi:hypothetical protein
MTRRETKRVACDNCNVVSQVTVTDEPPEDMQPFGIGGTLRHSRVVEEDKECAVCGATLSVSRTPELGQGGGSGV